MSINNDGGLAYDQVEGLSQRKREQLQRILEVNKDFAMDIGTDALLERIAQAAGEILGFNAVALIIVDTMGQNLTVEAVAQPDQGWVCKILRSTAPLDEIRNVMQEECKISHSYLIRHGHELWERIVGWNKDALDSTGQVGVHWDPDIAVLVPLETQDGQLVGVLALGEPRWTQLPSQDVVQVAEIFASTVTVAIENARLYEAEKRRATQMTVISEVAHDIASILNLKDLLERIVESIQRGFDCHNVALFLFDEINRDLVVHAVAGAYADMMPSSYSIPLQKGLVGWAAYTGETKLANDVKRDKQYSQEFAAAAATQAELSVPLKLVERVVGVLDLQSDRSNAFSEIDVTGIQTLSDQIAVAIENARLFSRVQEFREFNENIVQSMEGGVLVEDAEGRITFANPKMETMLGYPLARLIGHHWSDIVAPAWVEKGEEERTKHPQGLKARYEAALLHERGTEVPVAVNATPLFEKGEFAGVLTVFMDITETRLRIAEAERERLQGELHEALNVLHAGVMLEAEASRYRLQERQYEQVEAALDRLWKVSRHTYGELSNILQDLRDPILEKEGLTAALTNYAETIAPHLIVVHSEIQDRLDRDCEHALYRIAQGAISNARRHADLHNIPGGQIRVDLMKEGKNLTLRIEDNGKGFDVDAMKSGYPMAFGLERMNQWAETIGAILKIDSKPGRGTIITTTVSSGGRESYD